MKIRHVGLIVSNLPNAMRFYERLGFITDAGSVENWYGNQLKIVKMASEGECRLELVAGVWQPHFAITVDKIPGQMVRYMGKMSAGHEIIFTRDPDGNVIELVRER